MGRGPGRNARAVGGSGLTRLLLDTTLLVDIDRGATGLDSVVGDDDDLAIAAVTVAELRVGVELASHRARAAREAFLHDLLEVLPVLAYDRAVAEAHAGLLVAVRRQGRPRGAHDLIIAATARTTGREVVTADLSAFANLPGVGVRSHRE